LLLLLPLLWIIRELIRRKSCFLLPATLLLWVDLAYILLMLITLRMQMEIWNVLVPLAVLIYWAWSRAFKPVQGKEDDQSNPAAG
jgi:membrane protein implicated in regulation of membrane protease activity